MAVKVKKQAPVRETDKRFIDVPTVVMLTEKQQEEVLEKVDKDQKEA